MGYVVPPALNSQRLRQARNHPDCDQRAGLLQAACHCTATHNHIGTGIHNLNNNLKYEHIVDVLPLNREHAPKVTQTHWQASAQLTLVDSPRSLLKPASVMALIEASDAPASIQSASVIICNTTLSIDRRSKAVTVTSVEVTSAL